MATMSRADKYSRLVLWLKVALPLAALAILSTLFLVAETLDPDAAIPYAEVDVEKILQDQGITRPTFGGVTNDGVAISIAAEAVRPGNENRSRLTGTELSAKLTMPNGATIDIRSPVGVVDATTKEAILQGGAHLESSTGYSIRTDRIVMSFAEARAATESQVIATGPAGDITAGRMELQRQAADNGSYLLVFNGGVRLIYDPSR